MQAKLFRELILRPRPYFLVLLAASIFLTTCPKAFPIDHVWTGIAPTAVQHGGRQARRF